MRMPSLVWVALVTRNCLPSGDQVNRRAIGPRPKLVNGFSLPFPFAGIVQMLAPPSRASLKANDFPSRVQRKYVFPTSVADRGSLTTLVGFPPFAGMT